MDEDQLQAYQLALSGHNLLILGQAGTGKTFLTTKIVKSLRHRGKHVSVTSSTGIAATHYGDLGACTLHKWGGLHDGRYQNSELLHLILTDERFGDVKGRILNTDVLVIDEVSMVSNRTLSQVELICRKVRRDTSTCIFGNIQVILCGDFLQLPPVANELHGDFGHFCFESTWFQKFFVHKISLNIIHRQDSLELISAVNNLEKGILSDECVTFLKSLSRPLSQEKSTTAIHLFAKNFEADMYNFVKLGELPGEMVSFASEDEGSHHYLNKMLAPKNLGLKPSCSVMLLINLSDKLVNGLIGTVKTIKNYSIDVNFPSNNLTVNIKKFTFTTYDPVSKSIIAKRIQYPLKLSYGTTIHKSQGMSLDSVVVHCDNISFPGQLGVAVGRATSTEGLQVLNFRSHYIKQHPVKVDAFYENILIGDVHADLSCCRKIALEDEKKGDSDQDDGDESEDSDGGDGSPPENLDISQDDKILTNEDEFSDVEEDVLNLIDEMLDSHISEHINDVLKQTVIEFNDTPVDDIAKLFQKLVFYKPDIFQNWFESQLRKVNEISQSVFPSTERKFTSKQMNSFYKAFNDYLNSDLYQQSVVKVISTYIKSGSFGVESQIMTSVMFNIQKNLLKSLASGTQCEPLSEIKTISENISSGGRGKIRYIAGYCIAKIKYSLSSSLRSKLFNLKHTVEVEKLQKQMQLLESVCVSEAEISSCTSDRESLEETKRKQNIMESLTNITDDVYSFFNKLDCKCWDFLNYENLVTYDNDIFQALENNILSDTELIFSWTNVFRNNDIPYTSEVTDSSAATEIVHDICVQLVEKIDIMLELQPQICKLFMKVCISQFRKDYLNFIKKEKGKALRKKVMEKSKKSVKKLDINFILNDDSENKNASHYRLKSELAVNKELLSSSSFTKNSLLLIGKAYGVKLTLRQKRGEMAKTLNETIEHAEAMPFPIELSHSTSEQQEPSDITNVSTNIDEPEPPTAASSTVQEDKLTAKGRKVTCKRIYPQTRKGKGKGKSKRSRTKELDDNCTICNQPYSEGDDIICCDTCQSWFDRHCAKLDSDELWNHYQQEDVHFDCPLCQ